MNQNQFSTVQIKCRDRIVGLFSQAHSLSISGDYKEALKLYDRIIADVPALISRTPQINYERALCLKALGRIHDAEQAIRSSLSINPDDPDYLQFLSEIQFAIGSDISPNRESKIQPWSANIKQSEEVDRLYVEVKTHLPLVQKIDIILGLRAISSIEDQIVGRACGSVRNKLLNYLSIVQFARATGSKTADSIEIGTLFGGSCLMKLFAMRDLGVEGKVVCIDPMTGYYGHQLDPTAGIPVRAEVFLENIERFGFTKEVVDLRDAKSNDHRATERLREGAFATLLIDGDHSYRGVRYDWENYNRFIADNGIVLLDDYSEPKWPEITVFANELIDSLPDGWIKLGHLGTVLLLSRPPRRSKQASQEPCAAKRVEAKLLERPVDLNKGENVVTIIDPETISKRVDLINELAQYGINHLTKSPALGWNYVLDHVWITDEIDAYLANNRRRDLTVLDVGCGRTKFHNFLEKKFGINILGIDRPEGYCHISKLENVDYYADFLEMAAFGENSVDIIFWLSAIEHNEKEKIRQLFRKSMSLLKEGGLFLATFAISKETHWFEDSQQTNLSAIDSMNIFDKYQLQGKFDEIKEKYRRNLLFLRDKYERRYKRFSNDDPEFIVGAVKKVKAKTRVDYSSSSTVVEPSRGYLFMPSNDTHVHFMLPVAKRLKNSQFIVRSKRRENSDFYLKANNKTFLINYPGILNTIKPSVVILGIDWGPEERQIIEEAKQLGIPTVCIQEGCLDFLDKGIKRLMRADYIFLQGPKMSAYLNRKDNIIITGNPKYDNLNEVELPSKNAVMINSNFTYGIYEDTRHRWIRDVVDACNELGLYFFISQHPRDNGVFPSEYKVVKSDAFKLKEQLEQASVLVSRFSTVIYEAVAMGREAIYYNPHHEPFRIFAEDNTGGIWLANNPSELVSCISLAIKSLGKNEVNRNKFLSQHCGTLNHDATERCARELQTIARRHASTFSYRYDVIDEDERQDVSGNDERRPSVSVIIPCYNTAKYLRQAIESVLTQTWTDFEIIIVNDGSTDDTAEVVQTFDDTRIRYIYQKNKGLSGARNTGIRNSHGKYLTFLDADDCFLPNKLKDQVTFLRSYPEVGLVIGRTNRIDCNGNIIIRNNPSTQYVRPEEIIVASRFAIHSTLVRRSWVERVGFFDETLHAAEDWDYHCRLAVLGCRMYQIDKVVCAYRFLPGSMSGNAQQQTDAMLSVVKKTFSNHQLPEIFQKLENKALGYTHLKGAVRFYAAGLMEQGKYHMGQALRLDPHLCEKNYQKVISLFIYWIDNVQIKSPIEYLDSVFNNLPEETQDMRKFRIPVLQWTAQRYGQKEDQTQRSGSFRKDTALSENVLAMSNALLSQYKYKHRGQRCVIIGNGPSLNKMDLSFLKNEITFGMNRIYLLFDKWDFRPTYYVSVNPLVIEQSVEKIREITTPRFLALEGLPFIGTAEENIFIQRRPGGAYFSDDPRKGCWWPTVTYAAMQLAYFMGFSEVFLIGVDHYFKTKGDSNKEIVSDGVDEDHFHPDYFGKGIRWNLPDLEKSEVAYRLAKQAFEAAGRRIMDATVDGHLTIFPKVDYKQIFLPALLTTNNGESGPNSTLINTEFEDIEGPKFDPLVTAEPHREYLVSAIVSTYNSERFLRGCLDDLEQQTIADRLQIIVVNSGSQENEEAIVHEYQQKYSNIVYIKTEQREGIYSAWNRAVMASQGTYLTNANTDDRHRKDAIEIMAKTLQENPDIVLVYGDQICTDTPNGTFNDHHATEMARRPEYSRERLIFGNCMGSQPMWRRSLHNEFGYFDESLTCASDWDFWLRISNKYRFKHIAKFLGLYYYNECGIEHGRKIHSLYERYIVGKRYGNPYISVIPQYKTHDNPLVSVIMPAYNAADYIAEAIESVLIQNYRNFELVIINDGSTDDTEEIVHSFKDERIRYFRQENQGLAATHNTGIRESRGEFIIKLDADDKMKPDFIAGHIRQFENNPEADLVYCDDFLIDQNDKPIRIIKRPEYADRKLLIRDMFRCGYPIVPFRTCIRKSVFDKIGFFDESLPVGEDYDMMRRFVKLGLKICHLPDALYLRRMTENSLSRNLTPQKAKCQFELVKRFTETFSHDELFPDVEWYKMPANKIQLHAKCLAVVTYLAIGQDYLNSHSAGFYANIAFQHACSELRDCLKIDPGNRQIRELLQKCELGIQRYEKHSRQLVC